MSLEIFIDTRIDSVVDLLAESLAGPRANPFAAEMVVVPSAGMRRWLEQQLASRLGIAANIDMAFPAQLTNMAKEQCGVQPSIWTVEAITAQILAAAHDGDTQPHLRGLLTAGASVTRVPRARAIADLFDRYHVHRPDMVRSWADNRDLGDDGVPLPDHQIWQPQLWRQVRQHLGDSPPEVFPTIIEALAAGSIPAAAGVELPNTIHVFGLTVVTTELRAILNALAAHHTVRVFATAATSTVFTNGLPASALFADAANAANAATFIHCCISGGKPNAKVCPPSPPRPHLGSQRS